MPPPPRVYGFSDPICVPLSLTVYTEVEIFSDEIKVKCQKCGKNVYREKIPSCIDWCASARQCLGEEKWEELKGRTSQSQPQKNN